MQKLQAKRRTGAHFLPFALARDSAWQRSIPFDRNAVRQKLHIVLDVYGFLSSYCEILETFSLQPESSQVASPCRPEVTKYIATSSHYVVL